MAEKDNFKEIYESPHFAHGVEVGKSIGAYETAAEALRAYELGEIELWLDYMRPKSSEDWDAWCAEHGSHESMRERWKQPE